MDRKLGIKEAAYQEWDAGLMYNEGMVDYKVPYQGSGGQARVHNANLRFEL